ncbi:MAG: aspartate kinase [Bacilli bacterium]|nr:aspartate kinase [Bacilli bacterium]
MEKSYLIVDKFGGSSVASSTQFKKVKEIIKAKDSRKVVIVSALGKRTKDDNKITDLLYLLHAHLKYSVAYDHIFDLLKSRYVEIKNDLNIEYDIEAEMDALRKDLNKNMSLDYLVSRGEYFCAKLMASYLGYDFIDSKDVICFEYNGKLNEEKTDKKLVEAYEKSCDKGLVIPGFYGAYPNGDIHLLSRGGSDITGSIVAKALNASMYENWTDVSGILMADPRIVDSPKRINEITYDELREMSYMGANVLHEETIFPVQEMNIPINILNTNDPTNPGTIITNKCKDKSGVITGLSGIKDFTSITITKDFMADKTSLILNVLEIFKKYGVVVEHLPSSIDSFSVIVAKAKVEKYLYDIIGDIKLNSAVKEVSVDNDIALVAVVGRNMVTRAGISGKIFGYVGEEGINIKMISQGSHELAIIFGVSNNDFEKTIKVLYNKLVK